MEKDMNFDILLKYITKASRDMWDRGWAEANGGNISLRLNLEQYKCVSHLKPKTDFIPLQLHVRNLANERFLITGTGRYLRNIELAPERNAGFIEIDEEGTAYRILWGFEPQGEPTSEITAHLQSHSTIKESTDNYAHAVIHTHTPNLIALTYVDPDLTTQKLTHLLWQMHAECVVVFPQGIEFIPWLMAGSPELGLATSEALRYRPLAVWEHHGVCGTGKNLDEAFGRIYVAEKAAEIYLKVLSAGGIKKTLTEQQILRIADNFNCDLDVELFNS